MSELETNAYIEGETTKKKCAKRNYHKRQIREDLAMGLIVSELEE